MSCGGLIRLGSGMGRPSQPLPLIFELCIFSEDVLTLPSQRLIESRAVASVLCKSGTSE